MTFILCDTPRKNRNKFGIKNSKMSKVYKKLKKSQYFNTSSKITNISIW